jgi:hypothetical protein
VVRVGAEVWMARNGDERLAAVEARLDGVDKRVAQ